MATLSAVEADLRSLATAATGREGLAGQLTGLFTGAGPEHAAVRAACDKAVAAIGEAKAAAPGDEAAALGAAVEVSLCGGAQRQGARARGARSRGERKKKRCPARARNSHLFSKHSQAALDALLAGATAVFNQYCAIRVMKARKAEGVAFPTLYAAGDSPSAVRFNCVQRGHQQFLENLPITALLVGLIAQLAPRLAVGLAATWLAGRVIYFNGYAAGDPKGRVPGAAVSALAQLVMMVTAVVWGAKTLVVGA